MTEDQAHDIVLLIRILIRAVVANDSSKSDKASLDLEKALMEIDR